MIEKDKHFKTVQVKTARINKNCVVFNTCSNNKGYNKKSYNNEIDFIGAYCITTDSHYLIPCNSLPKTEMRLRLSATKNNQIKGILFAIDFQI